jgi:hypothetical protein
MKMVRKQVYITEGQEALLKRLAEERGLTEAEIIRTALDSLKPLSYQRQEQATHGIRETAVMDRYLADSAERTGLDLGQELADAAWEQELAFLKSLGRGEDGRREGEAWKFNREELYDERLDKILRRH